MALKLEEAAAMLGVSSDTVRRWSRQGMLGVRMPTGEFTFDAKELRHWARNHGLSIRPIPGFGAAGKGAQSSSPIATTQPFLGALQRGCILKEVEGQSPEEVLHGLVGSAPLAPEVDRKSLLEQLLQRESLTSTGLGDGVALPHPRTPSTQLARECVVVLAMLKQNVDWQALDGKPVHTVILLLSPTPAQHLRILSHIAFLLRDPEFSELLASRPEPDLILDRISGNEPKV